MIELAYRSVIIRPAYAALVSIALSACAGGEGPSPASSPASVLIETATSGGPATVANPGPTVTPTPTPTLTPTPAAAPTPAAIPTPAPIATPTASSLNGILDEGDSISVFWGGNHTGIFAAAHPSIKYYGRASGGSWLRGTRDGNDLTARFGADAALKPKIVTLLVGGADLGSVGPYGSYKSAQEFVDTLWVYIASWKATGAKVYVGTILPRCQDGNPNGVNETVNTNRALVNNAIRAGAGAKADGVIDYAADPVIGPDRAACDRSLYSDGIHPTDGAANGVGGQGKMALIYAAALAEVIK